MALCPFATVRLLPPSSPSHSTRRIRPTQVIAHSIGDPGATADDLYRFWAGAGSTGESSHFFVAASGEITQFVDTEVECFASLAANHRTDGTGAVAFESEDIGDPDSEPWTPAAVASIIRLVLWLVHVHPDIARRQCRAPADPGLGHHSMWGYNTRAEPTKNPWTRALGKTCPGMARIPQWQHTIIPAVLAGQTPEDDMPSIDEVRKVVREEIATALGRRYDKGADTPREALAEIDKIPGVLAKLTADVAEIKATLTKPAAG
jgi:hypothetical protein